MPQNKSRGPESIAARPDGAMRRTCCNCAPNPRKTAEIRHSSHAAAQQITGERVKIGPPDPLFHPSRTPAGLQPDPTRTPAGLSYYFMAAVMLPNSILFTFKTTALLAGLLKKSVSRIFALGINNHAGT